jgi:hypothetical protein
MARMPIQTRRAGACCVCRGRVNAGVEVLWDPRAKTVTCATCAPESSGLVSGPAGGSARVAADRRRATQATRQRRIKAAHPVLGRMSLVLYPEPDAGRSFAAGAIGEEKLGAMLSGLADRGVDALDDRRLPGWVGNIDHLVMTKARLWVIDAKRYGGSVTLAAAGQGPEQQLLVSGRDRSKLLQGLQRQVDQVRGALDRGGAEQVEVSGALCFVDTELPLRQRPLTVRGHLVSWPKNLRKHLLEAGTYDADDRTAVLRLLARSFPPAT